jgi:hypothetical protein
LAADMAVHCSTETSRRRSKAMSSAWPAIIAAVASAREAEAAAPVVGDASRRTWWARTCRASPATMAGPTPNNDQTVGRWWRSVSVSMMSSWMSEKLWTSSTATPPGTPRSGSAHAASAPRMARVGRTPFPPGASAGLPSASVQPMW